MDSSYKLQEPDVVFSDCFELTLSCLVSLPDPPVIDRFSLLLKAFKVVMTSKLLQVLFEEYCSQFI